MIAAFCLMMIANRSQLTTSMTYFQLVFPVESIYNFCLFITIIAALYYTMLTILSTTTTRGALICMIASVVTI